MKPTAVKSLPLALLIVSLATFSSCKKDKDDASSISIQSISGSYKLGAWTYQLNQMPVEDMIQYMDDCEKDDLFTFKNDKSFTYADAGVQCAPAGDYDGDWNLPSSTKIIIDGEEFQLDSFDGTTLKISRSETISGDTEVYRTTLNKQ
jgi:hypothetical protein